MRIEYPGIVGSGEIYLDVLKAICAEDIEIGKSTLLDLMCHRAPYTSQLGFSYNTFVDIQYRGLDLKPNADFTFIRQDVMEFIFTNYKYYTVSICSDGIEHLSHSQGYILLDAMKRLSTRQIIFTPLGDQSLTTDDHPDAHKSGWWPYNLDGWSTIEFPNFHPQLNCGAFFAYHLNGPMQPDFERVKQELNNKSWTKLNK